MFLLLALLFAPAAWAADESSAAAALQFDPAGNTSFSFDPISVPRDPFSPPALKEKGPLNDLTAFDTNEIKLVAIVTGMGAPQAMFTLPNNKTHIVRVGDNLGRRNGVITSIRNNEVVVRESFVDFRGKKKTSLNTLVLDDEQVKSTGP